MEYLKRRDQQGVLLRSGVQVAMPWARSVIVCALNYNAGGPLSIDEAPPGTGWIARYAWSGQAKVADTATNTATETDELVPTDYHDQLLRRLRQVEAALHNRFACETRCYVDTGPLVERTVAANAGVGWIGKNTCVINQELGSWLLLGVIVTSLPVAAGVEFQIAADRCGSCTRCIDACPTDALVAPREMDASRCIAYLTIEKKGAIAPGASRTDGPSGLRLRYLPGRLPLEPSRSGLVQRKHARAPADGKPRAGLARRDGCSSVQAMVQGLSYRADASQTPAPQCCNRHGQQRRTAVYRSTGGMGRGG